jgi:hypothetical protein
MQLVLIIMLARLTTIVLFKSKHIRTAMPQATPTTDIPTCAPRVMIDGSIAN